MCEESYNDDVVFKRKCLNIEKLLKIEMQHVSIMLECSLKFFHLNIFVYKHY